MLASGNKLANMSIPKGNLVMLVKRGSEFIIPNGQMELHEGSRIAYYLRKQIINGLLSMHKNHIGHALPALFLSF